MIADGSVAHAISQMARAIFSWLPTYSDTKNHRINRLCGVGGGRRSDEVGGRSSCKTPDPSLEPTDCC